MAHNSLWNEMATVTYLQPSEATLEFEGLEINRIEPACNLRAEIVYIFSKHETCKLWLIYDHDTQIRSTWGGR